MPRVPPDREPLEPRATFRPPELPEYPGTVYSPE